MFFTVKPVKVKDESTERRRDEVILGKQRQGGGKAEGKEGTLMVLVKTSKLLLPTLTCQYVSNLFTY